MNKKILIVAAIAALTPATVFAQSNSNSAGSSTTRSGAPGSASGMNCTPGSSQRSANNSATNNSGVKNMEGCDLAANGGSNAASGNHSPETLPSQPGVPGQAPRNDR